MSRPDGNSSALSRSKSIRHAIVGKITDARVADFIRTKRSVKKWIEEVLDINGDLDEDLYVSLRSGIILCYLMTAIEERSIPRIQENTDHQFKLKENILFFLGAVQDYGVPKYKLFLPSDLWDNECIVTVVECVAELGRIAAKKGFPITMTQLAPEGENSNESILKKLSKADIADLKDQLSRVKEPPTTKNQPKVSEAILRRKLALLAGGIGDIAGSKLEKGITRFQAVVRMFQAKKLYHKRVRDQAHRDNCAKEILSTEQVYVKYLGLCITLFIKPLKEAAHKKKPILEESQIKSIFSDLEMIYSFNSTLLAELTPIVEKWNAGQCLGNIFLKIMDYLKLYSGFIQNFNHSLDTIHGIRKNKAWEKFLVDVKLANPDLNRLDLPSLLIMPVQRVPRYNLLLKDLLKHTWKDHPDYKPLEEATERIDQVAALLNDKKAEAESHTMIMQIQNSIIEDKVPFKLASEGRRYTSHVLVNDKSNGYAIYVFNDCILFGQTEKKIEKKLEKRKSAILTQESVSLPQIKVKETIPLDQVTMVASADGGIDATIAGKKYLLFTKAPPERTKFLNDLNKVKTAYTKAHDQKAAEAASLKKETEVHDVKDAEKKLRERRLYLSTASAPSSAPNSAPSSAPSSNPSSPLTQHSPQVSHPSPSSANLKQEEKSSGPAVIEITPAPSGGSHSDPNTPDSEKRKSSVSVSAFKRFTFGGAGKHDNSIKDAVAKAKEEAKASKETPSDENKSLSKEELQKKKDNLTAQIAEMNKIATDKPDKSEKHDKKSEKQKKEFAEKLVKQLNAELANIEAALQAKT
eukprot:TRINITY_DN1442_c0_g1_i1.p1 TRINITY_DN1442_c0_g1~~TRINITY_DN1442_c0_g1_i1.p1  ORF type:complete len:806 (+),score=343.01 TRINITY_DN1442_c0_g1_i1:243-2660(+)